MKKKNIFLGLILLICLTFGLIFSNNVTTVFALENNAPKDSTNIVQTENKSVNNTRSQNNVNKDHGFIKKKKKKLSPCDPSITSKGKFCIFWIH